MRIADLDLNHFCKFLRCLDSFIEIYLPGNQSDDVLGISRICYGMPTKKKKKKEGAKCIGFHYLICHIKVQLIRIPYEFSLYSELYSS